MHPLTLLAAGIVLFAFFAVSVFSKRSSTKIPVERFPGPTLIPWIGRIHDLPIQYMWLKFKEWADEYGPIYKTEMLGAKFLIVSDEKIAEELLVKRAKINSDRPQVRSLFDSKSTDGSMEYLPLMGKNSASTITLQVIRANHLSRILGSSAALDPCFPDRSFECAVPRNS